MSSFLNPSILVPNGNVPRHWLYLLEFGRFSCVFRCRLEIRNECKGTYVMGGRGMPPEIRLALIISHLEGSKRLNWLRAITLLFCSDCSCRLLPRQRPQVSWFLSLLENNFIRALYHFIPNEVNILENRNPYVLTGNNIR